MPADITPQLQQLTIQGRPMCVCWVITRVDGVVIRLTSNDRPIVVDGQTFTPVDSIDSSARQSNQGTKTENAEVKGVISSDLITVNDLRAGRYRDASVLEFVVSPQFPWLGKRIVSKFWIEDTSFSGEQWTGTIIGLMGLIRTKIGRRFLRNCDATFGDARCGFDIDTLKVSGVSVDSIFEPKRRFDTALTEARGYWNLGTITWLTGDNAGLKSEVKGSTGTGRLILQLTTPFDIQVGDTFDIVPGCDLRWATCKDRFSNGVNFRGFKDIPGNDRLLTTPDAR